MATAAPGLTPNATTTASSERRACMIIRVAGTAALLLTVAFLVILPAKPVHENIAGFTNPMLSFELASQPEHVFGVLGRPGDPGRDDAVRRIDLGNYIDFLRRHRASPQVARLDHAHDAPDDGRARRRDGGRRRAREQPAARSLRGD